MVIEGLVRAPPTPLRNVRQSDSYKNSCRKVPGSHGGKMTYTFVSDMRGKTSKGTGSQSGFNQVLRAGKWAKTGTTGGCSQEVISHPTAFST